MSPKPRTSRSKTKSPRSTPSQWEIAKALAQHFGCSPNTSKQWFASGCPLDFDQAVAWKARRDADRSIRAGGTSSNRILRVIDGKDEAARADVFTPLAELSENFREAVDVAVELRQAGLTTKRIAGITGFSFPVLRRIFQEDKRLAPRKQATTAWGIAREMAVDRLIDVLESEEAAKKLSGPQLATIAGIASDKIRDLEPPPEQVSISIKAKIEAMSYEELINSIPHADTIDAEFEPMESPAPALPPKPEGGGISANNIR